MYNISSTYHIRWQPIKPLPEFETFCVITYQNCAIFIEEDTYQYLNFINMIDYEL